MPVPEAAVFQECIIAGDIEQPPSRYGCIPDSEFMLTFGTCANHVCRNRVGRTCSRLVINESLSWLVEADMTDLPSCSTLLILLYLDLNRSISSICSNCIEYSEFFFPHREGSIQAFTRTAFKRVKQVNVYRDGLLLVTNHCYFQSSHEHKYDGSCYTHFLLSSF